MPVLQDGPLYIIEYEAPTTNPVLSALPPSIMGGSTNHKCSMYGLINTVEKGMGNLQHTHKVQNLVSA